MNQKRIFDTIVFQYPGSVEKFHEEYAFPNDKYEVTLCPHASTKYPFHVASASSNLFYLTIKWNKICCKFIRIKVYDLITTKVLLKQGISKVSKTSEVHKYVVLKDKPALCMLQIYTYETISKVERPLTEPKKTDIKIPFIKREFEQQSIELRVLLDTGAYSDVTMTDGENEMHLHKLILSARSSVFNKMFQHPTKEMLESIIKITDIPFNVMRVVVDYMYSGVAKIEDMEMARNVFVAADKYDIQLLREICLSKLKCISLEDVLDNLLLANFYGEKDLMDIAFTYISKNYSKVKNLQQWNEITTENKDLAIGILSYLLYTKTEK